MKLAEMVKVLNFFYDIFLEIKAPEISAAFQVFNFFNAVAFGVERSQPCEDGKVFELNEPLVMKIERFVESICAVVLMEV